MPSCRCVLRGRSVGVAVYAALAPARGPSRAPVGTLRRSAIAAAAPAPVRKRVIAADPRRVTVLRHAAVRPATGTLPCPACSHPPSQQAHRHLRGRVAAGIAAGPRAGRQRMASPHVADGGR